LEVLLLTVEENCLHLIRLMEGLSFPSVTCYLQGASGSRRVAKFRSCKKPILWSKEGTCTGVEWAIRLRTETMSVFWWEE